MASGANGFAIFAAASTILIACTFGHPVRYDQRQEGDLNIRTDVEDVVLVVVPPKDLIAAGMGMVAGSAASLLKKNHVGDFPRPERWHYRPHTKWAYTSLDKAPFKIDLGKPEFHKKKVVHHGDPNRYNFHDDRVPVRTASTGEPADSATFEGDKTTTMPGTMMSTTVQSMNQATPEKTPMEMTSNTENKTVKKDLTKENGKGTADVANTNNKHFEEQKFDDPKVSGTKFSESKVSEAKVPEGLKVSDTKATDVKFEDPKFTVPKVSETKFSETKVTDAKFADSKVSGTKFSETKVTDPKFADSKVSGTKFAEGKVPDSKVSVTKIPDVTKFADSKHGDFKVSGTKPTEPKVAESVVSETKFSDGKNPVIKFSEGKIPEVKVVKKPAGAADDVPRVLGELSPGSLGPTSIFSHEGCGPEAYRDIRGICIYRKEPSK